jgi:hypothetical protein
LDDGNDGVPLRMFNAEGGRWYDIILMKRARKLSV